MIKSQSTGGIHIEYNKKHKAKNLGDQKVHPDISTRLTPP